MSEQPYHGTPEALRDFVAECMNLTAFYAGMAVDYAAVRDDAGLSYSSRRAVAALRQGISVLKMLEEANANALVARKIEKAQRDTADAALGA